MTTIKVAEGVEIQTMNPSWSRPFEVLEKRDHPPSFEVWLCKWLEPHKEAHGNYLFMHFGMVREKKSGITEAFVLMTTEGKTPEWKSILNFAMAEMERHECPNCKSHVVFKEKSRQVASEVIEVQYQCPKCKHIEMDVMD